MESVWHLKKLPASEVLLRFFSQNKRFSEFIPINCSEPPNLQVAEQCSIIWQNYMGSQAEHPVNVDSKSYKITQENMNNPDRYIGRATLSYQLLQQLNTILNLLRRELTRS